MDFDFSPLANLKDKDLSASGLMVLEGRILVEKALETGVEFVGLICSEEGGAPWLPSEVSFPVRRMSHADICELTGFKFHHGALALARRPEIAAFDPASAGSGAFLCVWEVTDPSNVGALIRSAAALGAQGVLVGSACADPYYRKALRASMGNAFSLPIYSCDEAGLVSMAKEGVQTIASTLSPRAVPLGEFSPRRPCVLLVGNEGYGLPEPVRGACSAEVCIPMSPGVDSLNVVVAGGICMYELFGKSLSFNRP